MSIFRIQPGDSGFIPIGRELYYRAGHLTISEWCERISVHALLILVAEGSPPPGRERVP